MDFRSEKLLLIDIGGTNFRSAISYLGSDEILETKKQSVDCLKNFNALVYDLLEEHGPCLLYTSPSPRDLSTSRMPSSA